MNPCPRLHVLYWFPGFLSMSSGHQWHGLPITPTDVSEVEGLGLLNLLVVGGDRWDLPSHHCHCQVAGAPQGGGGKWAGTALPATVGREETVPPGCEDCAQTGMAAARGCPV